MFSEESDIDKVVASEPWTFDKYLVALKRIQSQLEMKSLEFDNAHFWIQVHDLPVGSLNMRVVQDIVSVAGEVVNSRADNEDYKGGNFMRVRVKVDVTKPLSRGRKIGLRNGEESWASFKYECLPNLC